MSGTPVDVRRARPDDAEPLTDLHLDCWDDAYTGLIPQPVIDARRAQREARIEGWSTYVEKVPTWVASDETGLIGFACAGPGRDDPVAGLPTLELMSLYTRARVWGRGVGHALMVEAIADAPAYLWVLAANSRAVGFYQRHGFALDGVEVAQPEGLDARMVRDSSG